MDIQTQQLNVQVAVRVRPLSNKELNAKDECCLKTEDNRIILPQSGKIFTFDHVFNQDSNQEEIFDSCVTNLVQRCFEGYNSTILAYGQTGSGKTFTMGTSGLDQYSDQNEWGMIPRAVYLLFDEVEKRKQEQDQDIIITCSYIELYNEQIIDLLNESSMKSNLQPTIREEKDHTISIQNLTTISVMNPQDMLQILNKGGTHRTTAATQMNLNSSRSHAIFTTYFKINPESEEESLSAKFHFVDLAGSERLKKTMAIGKQMEEGININQSLLVLGNVIKTLSDQKKSAHVPYRESKLTRILQDSLGGNSNTYMIACISPSASNYEETINTLKYASRAREIKNKPTQNRDPHAAQIIALKQQILGLQGQIKQFSQILQENNINTDSVKYMADQIYESISPSSGPQQSCSEHGEAILKLKNQNQQLEKQLNSLQRELQNSQKGLSESMLEGYKAKKQRDQVMKQFQDAKKILQKYNIQFNFNEDQQMDTYYNEIANLKNVVKEHEQRIFLLQSNNDQLIKEARRDQKLLRQKQHELMRLEKRKQDVDQIDDDFELDDSEIIQKDLQIEEQEYQLQELDKIKIETIQLLQDDKQNYLKQISILEEEKAKLQKQLNTKQDSAQMNQLKFKISEYETKILDMRQKELTSKQLQKKLDDQESQVKELRTNIEQMKKQKVDLIKKMKQENEKYIKDKEQKHKELIYAKKQKIQQDTLVSKLKNDNTKKDVQLKRKEDELQKQKNEKLIIKQHNRYNPNKSLQYDTFEKQIDDLFSELILGEQAEEQITKEYSKLEELQEELRQIEVRICSLQIKIDQLQFDMTQNTAVCSMENIQQYELELNDFQQKRENISETIEFQLQKIDDYRVISSKANDYYTIVLTNQYFKDLPNWCTRSFRYVIDNWVKDHYQMTLYAQQIEELNQTNQELINAKPSPIKKSIRQNTPIDDLKRQINEYKRKLQALQNQYRTTSIELDYYKNFYSEQINKQQKDRSIGLGLQLQHSQSYHTFRNSNSKELKQEQQLPLALTHVKSFGQLGSSMRVRSSVSQYWIAEQLNSSQEIINYDIVKTLQGHDQPILSLYTKDNILCSGQYKQFKVWDIESQQLISTIDQSNHCRSIYYWANRDAFAVSHGSQISLYDPLTLMCKGLLKSSIEEIKCITSINGLLVAAGKSINSNALNIWDSRQNNILYEFEKGSDILSIYGSDENSELIYGTLKHYAKRIPFNKNKYNQIQQLQPPQLDKVTGVASFGDYIVSCSLSKRMLLWNQQTGLESTTNDSIHKDLITALTIDKSLKLIYTSCKDGNVRAIKVNEEGKFQLLHEITASNQQINALHVIQDNHLVISGGQDKLIKIWRPSKNILQLQNAIGEFIVDDQN
ncbi:unnamed protein product (macronuclear) [Paramecium tetraurelia]|uniref:Kinesin motor domain-containing protein n=1 Tax=Paramecium tetraurelia TaxID=5888 RepID=A0DYZ1_PARTE|nr:uncharacterized protein GSPATT00003226001 [Paramecium tetraurelia]CAK88258.1 unnamed protein product [Paramecium tetraurelia]|eukprot:XP_001455655.1 hypothetical protein (macronuclear) [Paramecium tetraurelia strain d4-2]